MTNQQSNAKRSELLQRLERGMHEVRESDNFQRYLSVCAKFHTYSVGNQMLIWLQRPDASHVAGFHSWRSLGRCVRKGEKGIGILAPVRFRASHVDEETGEEEMTACRFRTVYVFDVSQTDGEPIPSPVDELTGIDDAGLFAKLDSLAHAEGLTIDRTPGRAAANGFYSSGEIWIKPEASLPMATKTLTHELAHHFAGHVQCREESETIAEAVAFVVLGHFGIDASSYSFGYLASWSDVKTFKSKLGEINTVAKRIIDSIENGPPPTPTVTPHACVADQRTPVLADAPPRLVQSGAEALLTSLEQLASKHGEQEHLFAESDGRRDKLTVRDRGGSFTYWFWLPPASLEEYTRDETLWMLGGPRKPKPLPDGREWCDRCQDTHSGPCPDECEDGFSGCKETGSGHHDTYVCPKCGKTCDACKSGCCDDVTLSRNGTDYLVPGKDHRKKPGKATFRGRGMGSVCTSVAYWGFPIAPALTYDEWTLVTTVGRLAAASVYRGRSFVDKDGAFHRPRSNGNPFAPALYLPNPTTAMAEKAA